MMMQQTGVMFAVSAVEVVLVTLLVVHFRRRPSARRLGAPHILGGAALTIAAFGWLFAFPEMYPNAGMGAGLIWIGLFLVGSHGGGILIVIGWLARQRGA